MIDQDPVMERLARLDRQAECCGVPMVHNSSSGQYECADAYFALLDEDVIADSDPPTLIDPDSVSPEHRNLFDHWIASMRPDGWDALLDLSKVTEWKD